MVDEVFEYAPKMFEAERLANDEGVKGKAHDQWLSLALVNHNIELINRHFGEVRSRMTSV